MTDKKESKSQVAFSLATTKKKKKAAAVASSTLFEEFAASKDNTTTTSTTRQPKQRTSPLVIPLTQATTGPLAKLKQEDAAAAQALMDSAAQHFSSTQQTTAETNFSAEGNLSIASTKNTFERNKSTEEQDLQRDLEGRAEDVSVDSSAYQETPIAEFGAALLRGMGWKGNDDNNQKSINKDFNMPRPHRLGLGATPKLPELSNSNKPKRPDQVEREKRLKQQHDEYEAKRQQQVRLDKQQTLQVGSIVSLVVNKKRAKMVQLMGVPGLNRVLVRYEGESDTTAVKRGDVQLVSRRELEEKPYREEETKESVKQELKKENDGPHDRKRLKREENDSGRDRDDKRRRRDDTDRRHGGDRNRYNGSSTSHRQGNSDSKKRRRSEPDDEQEQQYWLIPNIRVRVVTKKLSSRQYKQKGLVLDVTHGGAYATLQMNDGQLLDRVPERYLETALPKVGGKAIILTGRHKLQKGKLLERNSDTGKGVIQVYEDMNVVKLSLDDMAEWCGPLDDDMEL